MTQLEIFQKIADAVNAAAGSKNPKMTIVTESEFGGVYFCTSTHIPQISSLMRSTKTR